MNALAESDLLYFVRLPLEPSTKATPVGKMYGNKWKAAIFVSSGSKEKQTGFEIHK